MISHRRYTVFKLGGSLLHTPDWPSRLRAWLCRQTKGAYFGIVGGGLLMNALRDLDDHHDLSEAEMHWRCIRTLDATYEIAAELMPDFDRIASNESLRSIIDKPLDEFSLGPHWVRIGAFYSPELLVETPSDLHPAIGWDTTSDCLALFLAQLIGAERCMLIKSCPVAHIQSLAHAVQVNIVDPECLRFQALVPSIELVQL